MDYNINQWDCGCEVLMNFSNRLQSRFCRKCGVINNLSNPSTKDFVEALA